MLMIRGLIIVSFVIVIWQGLVTIFDFPIYILPSPWEVIKSLIANAFLLWTNTIPTIIETLSGLFLGILLGMLVALLMVQASIIRYWLLPLIVASQAVPTFAIAPLLVLWFGYGMLSKIITVMLMLFFPVSNSFYEGLSQTKSKWLDMAKIMNAKNIWVLWRLKFPAAMPHLAVGIKIAAALAPIGAIVSEWVGASSGLGFLMLNANARLDIPLMFACVVIIMSLSLILYGAVAKTLKMIIINRPYYVLK